MTHSQTQGADGAGTKTAGQMATPRNKWREPDHHPIIGRWHVRHEIEAAADTGYLFGKNFVTLDDALAFCEQQKGQCRLLFHVADDRWLLVDRPFQFYFVGDADRTPAPAATPGVPDSVRALSEAASEDWDTNDATPYILGPQIDGEIDRFEVIARGPHGYAKNGDDFRKWQANRMFAVAAVKHVRTLLASHPAGQSAGSGAWAEHSPQEIVRRTRCMADETRDPVVWRDCCDLILDRLGKPAPDSTRTGQGEDWRDDPSADVRWNAGLVYGHDQLCRVLGVDPDKVSWDAATETLDGDVQSVIRNILRAWAGDDWQDAAACLDQPPASSGKVQLVEMDEIWTFKETRKYLLSEIERLRDDLHAVGKNLTGEQPEAVSCLDTAYGRTANISSILSNAPTATQIPASSDPAALAEQEEGDA